MKINNLLLLLLCSLLFLGIEIDALSYDYSATIECLEDPHKPQYGGGIVVNPELNSGLKGWTTSGEAKIEQRVSKGGNNFIVASNRHQKHYSFSQTFYLKRQLFYTFSAWLQVSDGTAEIAAIFKTTTGFTHAGWVIAESGCWSMLKGGLTVNATGPAELYFESNNTSVEIWGDSISLQPFTKDQWRFHQDQSIEKARKSKVKLQAVDAKGNPLANATVSVAQSNLRFPIGCAINNNILTNTAYQNWFTSRFKVTTFENEMKWYSTEWARGREDYSTSDAMLQLAKRNGIQVRGHNILWDDPSYQPEWVKTLSPAELSSAATKRLTSIVRRYAGQLIAWDVVNENLHFSFFESKLGQNASAAFYRLAHQLDPATTLFLNDYNTIEDMRDPASTPAAYLGKIRQIKSTGFNGLLGIGLEAHFKSPPNLPYIRASIDQLAAARLPIWLTELDVSWSPQQASYLEQILREAHAHPAVDGIVIWAAWKPEGCYQMCLTDNDFRNLPTGDVVDKLMREWSQDGSIGTTDTEGIFETSLFHGDYELTITHSGVTNSSSAQSLKVASTDKSQQTLHVKVSS